MQLFRRKGISLMEILIVIVVIVILSTVTTLSISRISAKAEAKRIMNNLQLLRTAVLVWCKENSEKIQSDGRIKIGTQIDPIQNYRDSQLGISKYLNASEAFNTANPYNNPSNNYGDYLVSDYGNGNRTIWYVGYRFLQYGEEDVRDRLKEMTKEQIAKKDIIFAKTTPNGGAGDNYIYMRVFYNR